MPESFDNGGIVPIGAEFTLRAGEAVWSLSKLIVSDPNPFPRIRLWGRR